MKLTELEYMIISLTGFMGCGKSSVGRRLSTLLSCSFADLDFIIENAVGRSIPEIFASDGEEAFRQMELDFLSNISDGHTMILALGGGTVMTDKCAELIHENTLCIYLRTSVDTLVRRLESEADGRPMLMKGISHNDTSRSEALRHRVNELMEIRSARYEKTAHITIDTDGKSVDGIADEIIGLIKAL